MGQEVLIGPERRRRWSDEQKRRILGEVGIDGARVSDVARRHAISRQQIYQWRCEMRRKGMGADEPGCVLLPVSVDDGEALPGVPAQVGERRHVVEIRLRNGRQLCAGTDVPDAILRRLIRVVEGA